MLEITDPARRLIRDAWRGGSVLVVSAPWRGYVWTGALFAAFRRPGDGSGLDECIRVGEGEGIYLRSDLLPRLRHRRLRLDQHSVLGLWRGIAVRDLDSVPMPVRAGRSSPDRSRG